MSTMLAVLVGAVLGSGLIAMTMVIGQRLVERHRAESLSRWAAEQQIRAIKRRTLQQLRRTAETVGRRPHASTTDDVIVLDDSDGRS